MSDSKKYDEKDFERDFNEHPPVKAVRDTSDASKWLHSNGFYRRPDVLSFSELVKIFNAGLEQGRKDAHEEFEIMANEPFELEELTEVEIKKVLVETGVYQEQIEKLKAQLTEARKILDMCSKVESHNPTSGLTREARLAKEFLARE
jgi:hypothetical protein